MLDKISKVINRFNNKQGEVASFLAIPLLVIVIYEVFMRYVFDSPTSWGFEATTFLYGIHYMFGLAYTDVNDAHVKVDIFTSRVSKKTQAIIGMLTTLIMFLPVSICLTLWTTKFAWVSLAGRELNSTSWAPPIYPFKIIMALTMLFLLAQGFSNLIKFIKMFGDKNN